MQRLFKTVKGSITVLVTLILVPTIFFTGFMVDLARIKLYGNQAVMTADNYGETVLTQYDNLLKELYGLFAVTQDDKDLNNLDKLQGYVSSSFDPAQNNISWEHFEEVSGNEYFRWLHALSGCRYNIGKRIYPGITSLESCSFGYADWGFYEVSYCTGTIG